jgi:phage-related baseplate assembly protein
MDQPDFETRLAGKLARLISRVPAFSALVESDPAILLLEADSYDELVLAKAFNDTAQGLLLAFASGANLDQLAAPLDVTRMVVTPATLTTAAVMESDAAFRQRIQLAPHRYSVAGPELAYVYHARSAHGDVADATARSPSPGEVVVTVMSASGDGVPGAAVLAAVNTVLQDEEVRPLTDHVTVQPAQLVPFTVEAQLYVFAGPDQGLILATAQASLDRHLADIRKLDRDAARSAMIAALHVGNVQRVVLLQPAADVPIGYYQLSNPTSVSVTIAGTEL